MGVKEAKEVKGVEDVCLANSVQPDIHQPANALDFFNFLDSFNCRKKKK